MEIEKISSKAIAKMANKIKPIINLIKSRKMLFGFLFFLLAAGQFNKTIHTIAGYEGIICGFSAIYLALAEVMNEMHQKTVMPIFPVKQ